MFSLNIDTDGRILSATFEKYAAPGQPIVESLPEGNVCDYRYVEGEYVYDPLPEPKEPEQPVSLESRVETLEADSAEAKEALEMILNGVVE